MEANKKVKITDQVMERVESLKQIGNMHLPANYSAQNAINYAYLELKGKVDKDGKNVMETCSTPSIANALFNMVIEGLSSAKKQCYFIAYYNKGTQQMELKYQRGYMGDMFLAKRDSGVNKIRTNIIYKEDEFVYEINPETGIIKILKHKQVLDNIDPDPTKIRGAYCYITEDDGTVVPIIMSRKQIMNSWNMRQGNGLTKAHEKFGDEMCRKTVIKRACKPYINTSDDSNLQGVNDKKDGNATKQIAVNEAEETTVISIEEAEPAVVAKEPVQSAQQQHNEGPDIPNKNESAEPIKPSNVENDGDVSGPDF